MVSLVDIGPIREKVTLRGTELEVKGLSADFIFQLLTRSTELRMLISQQKLDPDKIMELIDQAPTAVAECIACATGKQGDPETIAFALTELGAGETADLLGPILRLTFPKGVKSFADGLTNLAQEATGGRGWGAATKSPAPSLGSSEPDTAQAKPGDIPPGNSSDGPS
jgi:hypothetical protein